MPTVIDSLIVELQLDPKGFDASKRSSIEALRQFEKNARAAQQPLNNLSAQARRTGTAIAAGTAIGTTGLKNLALAGAEAFTALKTIEGLIGSITSASNRGAGVSRAAWAIGLPTKQLDSLIQAAYETAHVPQDTSINMLNAYQQRIEEQKRTGQWSQEFTELGRLGVNFSAPMLDQIRQIRQALHNQPGPQTENWVNATGLGPWLNFIKLSQQQADAAQSKAERHSLTGDQGEELEKLQTAAARVEDSMTHLWEVLSAKFSKEGLSPALEGFSELVDDVSHNETAMRGLEGVMGAVATLAGVTLVSALGKLVVALNGVWAAPLMRLLVSGGFWRVMGPIGAFLGVMSPGTAGGQSEVDAEKSLFRRALEMNGRTGDQRPKGRASGARGGSSVAAALPGTVFEAISQAEGTWRNGAINYDDMLGHPGGVLGTPPKPISQMTIAELLDWQTQMLNHPANKWNSSAAGGFQIIKTNIEKALQEGRIGLGDTFNAATQQKLASHLWNNGGSRHWEGFNAHEDLRGRAEQLASGGWSDPFAAVRGAPGVKFNSKGQPYSATLDSMSPRESANVAAAMATIKSAQTTGKPWYRNYDIDHNTRIDTVNIHTSDNPYAIGGAIGNVVGDQVKKNTMISHANSGLE